MYGLLDRLYVSDEGRRGGMIIFDPLGLNQRLQKRCLI